MRLAQLSRKVNAKPSEIRDFLKKETGIELDADPNAKFPDEHLQIVLDKFGTLEDIQEEEVTEELKSEAGLPILIWDTYLMTDLRRRI